MWYNKQKTMEIILSIGLFIKVFILMVAILYCLKVAYDIAKVYTLKEGKVELGKNGLLYLGCSVAYIMTCIFV